MGIHSQSHHNAQLSLDALFSIIPLVLIMVFTINTISFLNSRSVDTIEKQHVFNKLVSIADSVVKQKAVVIKSGNMPTESTSYPNWIDETRLNAIDLTALANQTGFGSISIALDTPTSNSYCIYRLVVVGAGMEIHKLYVCGD